MMEAIRRNASGWGVKVLFGAIVIVFVFWGVGSYNSTQGSVVGYVNEVPITIDAYRRQLENTIESLKRRFPGLDREMLMQMGYKQRVYQEMVDSILVRQRAQELGLTVADHEVRRTVSLQPAFLNELGVFDFERYRRILRSSGLNEAAYEQQLRDQILQEKIRSFVTLPGTLSQEEVKERFDILNRRVKVAFVPFKYQDYLDEAEPTEDTVQQYYQENEAKFTEPVKVALEYIAFTPEALAKPGDVQDLDVITYYEQHPGEFTQPEQVKARHILLRVDQNADDEARLAVKAKLGSIRQEIENGLDFAAAAQKYSDDGSASQGGDLGWFGRDVMVPPFESAAFSLEPGVVSEPVLTRFGWHLLKVEEKREAGTKPLQDVRETIRATIARENASVALADILDEATEQALSGIPLSAVAATLGLQAQTTQPFSTPPSELRAMPQPTANEILSMAEGEVSEPLPYGDGYIIASITARHEARLKPLDEVRDQVESEVQRQLARKLAMEAAQAAADKLQTEDGRKAFLAEREDDVIISEPFDRQGVIPMVGRSIPLAQAVLSGTEGWLPDAFEVPSGAIVARAEEILPPKEGTWEQQGQQYAGNIIGQNQGDLWDAFLSGLRAEAELELANPQYLE